MKRGLRKILLRGLKQTPGRFIALFLTVMIGGGFFAGLQSTAPSMARGANSYLAAIDAADIRLICDSGITADDLDALRDLPDVAEAYPAYRLYALCNQGGYSDIVALSSLAPGQLDGGGAAAGAGGLDGGGTAGPVAVSSEQGTMELAEGRLPSAVDECLVDAESRLRIGDALTIVSAVDGQPLSLLEKTQLTVVGRGWSPDYLSIDRGNTNIGGGQVVYFIYLPWQAFTSEYYTEVNIQLASADDKNAFTDGYQQSVDDAIPGLEDFVDARAQLRYQQFYTDAAEDLAEQDDGYQQYKDDVSELASQAQQQRALAAQYGLALQPTTGQPAQQPARLSPAQQQVMQQLQQSQQLLAQAQQQLLLARQQLDSGYARLSQIPLPEWYIQDRNDFPGYQSFDSDIQRIQALATILPWILFLVAALVALAIMTRMVDEHRRQIGMLKALGYQRGSIMAIYQIYAWSIGLAGGGVGVLLGLWIFPPSIWQIYMNLYFVGDFQLAAAPLSCVIGMLGGAVASALATFAASRRALGATASELMRPKPSRPGRRVFLEYIGPLWRSLPLVNKVTFRNLFRYKARFFMTVVGVAGCTALLLTGFGIRDSIDGMVDLQFGRVSYHQTTIILGQGGNSAVDSELNRRLKDESSLYVHISAIDVWTESRDASSLISYITVPERPDKAGEFYGLHDAAAGQSLRVPERGALVTQRLATVLGLGVGDYFELALSDGRRGKEQVAGIVENYVYNYIYISPNSYLKLFSEHPSYYCVLMRSDKTGDELDSLFADIASTDNVRSLMPTTQLREIVDQVVVNMAAVVWLIIATAALLALVVLYSLSSINITERVRELATLKVLGFFKHEISSYISRETTILTLLGLAFGVVWGVVMHRYVMDSIEVNDIVFSRIIYVSSFGLSLLVPLACSAVIALAMRPRLKRIEPVVELKSFE
jgi:putative ABC transport system permease protein